MLVNRRTFELRDDSILLVKCIRIYISIVLWKWLFYWKPVLKVEILIIVWLISICVTVQICLFQKITFHYFWRWRGLTGKRNSTLVSALRFEKKNAILIRMNRFIIEISVWFRWLWSRCCPFIWQFIFKLWKMNSRSTSQVSCKLNKSCLERLLGHLFTTCCSQGI